MNRPAATVFVRVMGCACLVAGAAPATAGVTITLHARAAPTDSVVRVGDVATVTADGPGDAVDAVRLRSVPLVPAPAAGRTATLSKETVRDRAAAGGFTVTLAGADAVVLTAARSVAATRPRAASPGDRAYGERFVTAAVSRVLTRAGAGPLHIEVALADPAARLLARTRPDGCDLTGLTSTPHVAQTITLRWLDRLDEVNTVQAAVRLSPPHLVPVLTGPIPRGAPITADRVAWRSEDAPAVPLTAVPLAPRSTVAASPIVLAGGNRSAAVPRWPVRPLPSQAAGLPSGEAIRDLPAGSVLDQDDLRQPLMVRANETVRVESRVGGVTVSRDLKANRNGSLGQTIPLSDPEGSAFSRRDRVYARVVGNRRAVLVGDAAATPAYAVAPGGGASGGGASRTFLSQTRTAGGTR